MNLTAANMYDVVASVIHSGVGLLPGMNMLLMHCEEMCPDPIWREIARLDFAADAETIRDWLSNLLKTEPPLDSIRALWFGLYDGANSDGEIVTQLYLAGSDHYDAADPSGGWACAPAYIPEGRYAPSAVLGALPSLLDRAGVDASELGGYVVALGYACMVVADACRSLPYSPWLSGADPGPIVVGFDSDDFITLSPVERAKSL